MTELELKYGCNPNQKPARIFMEEGDLPLKVLNGRPGVYQLHGRPELLAAGEGPQKGHRPARRRLLQARLPRRGRLWACPLSDVERRIYFAPEGELSPIACAYIRARGPTGCAPSETGPPCPMCATGIPPASWPLRYPTASSPRAIPTRPWIS